LTDAELAVVRPLLSTRQRLGRPRTADLRELVNAVLYVLRTGCSWSLLPRVSPPMGTVYWYFAE
jgi:transposase